ncbi:hypothetical protein ABIF72_007767 [Bradyrhizobium japonicum]
MTCALTYSLATSTSRLIPFNEILNSPSTPKIVAESGDHSIPVAFSYKGKDYNYNLTPDGRPFRHRPFG